MKFIYLLLLFLIFSCSEKNNRPHAKELVRFVNTPNDGFDAMGVLIFNDSTYRVEELAETSEGNYSMNDSVISFKTGKLESQSLVLVKNKDGCLGICNLASKDHTTNMRVVGDSLFCRK
jgi:hypothetical protein